MSTYLPKLQPAVSTVPIMKLFAKVPDGFVHIISSVAALIGYIALGWQGEQPNNYLMIFFPCANHLCYRIKAVRKP